MPATLSKEERLSSKKDISSLMHDGKWGVTAHLRYCHVHNEDREDSRIMVSVPKKNFKRAVKRNLLKRRLREAYRLQKDQLAQGTDLLLVYSSAEIADFGTISAEVSKILGRC